MSFRANYSKTLDGNEYDLSGCAGDTVEEKLRWHLEAQILSAAKLDPAAVWDCVDWELQIQS